MKNKLRMLALSIITLCVTSCAGGLTGLTFTVAPDGSIGGSYTPPAKPLVVTPQK